MSGRTRPLAHVRGLYELADQQLGIVGRTQLATLGITRHHVRSQLAAQRWQSVGPRVVALVTGPLTREQGWWVAQLHAGSASALFGLAGLEVLGLKGWEADMIDVAIPHDQRASSWERIRVHRLRSFTAADVRLRSGLRCVVSRRSAIAAASMQPTARAAASLILAVVQQRVCSVDELRSALDDAPHSRHASPVRRALDDAAGGADSHAEVDAVALLRRAGLTSIRRQLVVPTLSGPRPVDLVVDLPDGTLLVVEVDGPHHADPKVRAVDAEKDAMLIAAGHRVLRIPVVMLRTQPERVLANFRAIARAAGCQVAG